jgi:hypothetical protein
LYVGIEVVFVAIAALCTADLKMVAHQGIGHAAGRDAKGLEHKGPEYKGKYESRYQPFKRVGD